MDVERRLGRARHWHGGGVGSGVRSEVGVDERPVTAVDRAVVPQMFEIDTPTGTARWYQYDPAGRSAAESAGLLVLGHGAGGGVQAVDLVAVAAAAVAVGWCAVLVEQPWLVAGRRIAPAPARLDAGWVPTVAQVRSRLPVGPLVVGGRSAGARVACRTAIVTGAAGVVCLAFPLHPPGRPERSRLSELAIPAAAGVPALVVQGSRDAFGTAQQVRATVPDGVRVAEVDGDHGLAAGVTAVAEAVTGWLVARWLSRPALG